MKKVLFVFLFFILVNNVSAATEEVTVRVYSEAGDGRVYTSPYPGSWNDQRDDTVGRAPEYSLAWTGVGALDSLNSGNYIGIQRAFTTFDTSIIPDDATVVDVSLNLFATHVQDDVNDSYSYISVLEGTQTSATSLLASDIDNCGTLNNPMKGSADVDVTNISLEEYFSIDLNSIGEGWISPTGYTKLCLRTGHDIDDSEVVHPGSGPVWFGTLVDFSASEAPGTDKDPYLEITYTIETDYAETENSHSIDFENDTTDFLSAPDDDSVDLTGDMTIELWVKPESLTANHAFVSKWDSFGDNLSFGFRYLDGPGVLSFHTSANGVTPYWFGEIEYDLEVGVWQHLAVTFDASSGKAEFFVNGESIGSHIGFPTSIYDSGADINVGSTQGGREELFDGLVDEVRIWTDVRTQEELSTNMSTENIDNVTDLVAQWNFNQSLGSKNNDSNLSSSGSVSYSPDIPFPVTAERERLYTQIESPYPSEEETAEWADDMYAWGDGYWCGSTIAGCGCSITSLVMLGRQYGITTGVDGEDINPGSLNEWLQQNNGYDPAGNLRWSKALDYFGTEEDGIISTPIQVLQYKELNRNKIEDYVSNDETSVVGQSYTKGHFFYLSEVLNNGFEILDPLWFETRTTNDEQDIANNIQDYNDVVDRGVVIELVDSSPQTGVIEASIESPTELVLVNAEGERSGYTDEGVVEEIDGSGYVQDEIIASSNEDVSDEEGTNHLLAVNQSGLYQLYVVGTETTEYLLSLLVKDVTGQETYFEHTGDTSPGQIEVFTINLETGEVGLTPVDRTLFLLATARATAEDTDQIRRFFERWGNKIFDDIDGGKVKQAVQHISTFGKLQKAKKVVDSWLDELRGRLQEELEESQV